VYVYQRFAQCFVNKYDFDSSLYELCFLGCVLETAGLLQSTAFAKALNSTAMNQVLTIRIEIHIISFSGISKI